jgi:hypothetical protein
MPVSLTLHSQLRKRLDTARRTEAGSAGEGDVVDVAAVGAVATGLVVADVDAQRGFARGDGTDI